MSSSHRRLGFRSVLVAFLSAAVGFGSHAVAQCQPPWQRTPVGAGSQDVSAALWAGGSFTNSRGHFEPYITQLFCSCYVNCDNSATASILTANDFQCFLNQFAAGCN